MYGLPKNFDPEFVCGATLEQICFTENQVSFHFDHEISIIVESAIAYSDPNERLCSTTYRVPLRSSSIMHLLGKRVVEATRENDNLKLIFESGATLNCIDDTPQYEAYKIIHKGHVLIV